MIISIEVLIEGAMMPLKLTILLVEARESTRSAANLPVNNLDKRLVEWGLR